MKDIFGRAILTFAKSGRAPDIITWTSISDEDPLPIQYLFRSYADMPEIEQHALRLCSGHILDVGCGAGSHSLYLQQNKFHVTALDFSPRSVEACRIRGVLNVRQANIFEFDEGRYDTILLLMNGTGIAGTLDRLQLLFTKLMELLADGGQILIDSSDLLYMFDEDEIPQIRHRKHYYGEIKYYMSWEGDQETPLNWLYCDFDTLSEIANRAGLKSERIMDGENSDFLARLTKK